MSDRPSTLRVWLLASRPKTLPAAFVPVLVGSAFAAHAGKFHPLAAGLCLAFALLVQIGTNFANDFFDFLKGADTVERVGPKRAVAAGWVSPSTMRAATWLVFTAAFLVGLGLIRFGGWWLLPLGLVSIASGLAYTGGPYPLAYHGLGDLFVFLFFGLVAVCATYFVQTGAVIWEVALGAAAIGGLAANILVANNYRDRETDARAGKRTLVVKLGPSAATAQYALCVLFGLAVPVVLWARGWGNWVLLPLLVTPLAVKCVLTLKPATPAPALIALLGKTAGLLALYGVLLSVGLWIGR